MAATAPMQPPEEFPSRLEFLRQLYGTGGPGHLVFWRRSDKRSKWIPAERLEDADRIESDRDVYFSVALHDQRTALRLSANNDPAYVRGSIGSAVALGGLAADFDVQGATHKSEKLPRTFEEVQAFIAELPFAPTAIVNSGYGLQPWWFFKKLWVFGGDEEREEAQTLARRFHATIQALAAERGWSFDNTSDLARVFRLPETYNAKLPELVEVCIVSWRPDHRYDLSEFEQYLVEETVIADASTVDTAAVMAGVSAGERDSQLFRLACKFRHADLPREVADRLILETAGKCSPPFPEKEALGKVASAYKYPPGKASVSSVSSLPAPFGEFRELPSSSPEAPSLPPQLLPSALHDWLTDIADRMQVPLEFVAVPALVAISAVVGRTAGIHPKAEDDWLVVPNLWGGIIAPPGWLKSPTMAEALRPIKRLAVEARKDYGSRLEEYGPRLESLKAKETALKELMKQAHKGKAKKSPEQLEDDLKDVRRELQDLDGQLFERRYIVNDTTVEKLGELLAENPMGLLLERDELAGWLRLLDREDRKGDREFYLESWNGTNSYRYDRITRGSIHVPALCLSLIGGIQPAKFKKHISEALAGGYAADGLVQRLQLLVWPEAAGSWSLVDRSPNVEAQRRTFATFKSLDQCEYEKPLASEENIPSFRFAPDAQKLFYVWLSELEPRLRSPEAAEQPAFTSHLAKYRSLMPSLALLFHLIEMVDGGITGPVTLRAAQLAADWCGFLERHARKIYAAELQADLTAAHALAVKIRKGAVYDGMTMREMYRPGWASLKTPESVRVGAQVLEQHGWAQVVTVETGGRSSQVLRINPALRRDAA